MKQLNPDKLAKLPTFNKQLDAEYGRPGTPDREGFHEEALSWYYGQLLRNRRHALKMTQKEVAEKLGREQSYIAPCRMRKSRHSTVELYSDCRRPRNSVHPDICPR